MSTITDRHRLWRRVRSHYEQLEKVLADGYEPVVEVFLVGREEPVVPAYVETSSSKAYPWVVLQSRAAVDQSGCRRPEPARQARRHQFPYSSRWTE